MWVASPDFYVIALPPIISARLHTLTDLSMYFPAEIRNAPNNLHVRSACRVIVIGVEQRADQTIYRSSTGNGRRGM